MWVVKTGESVAGVWHNQPMKHEANSSRSSSAILARPAQTKSPKSPVVPGGSDPDGRSSESFKGPLDGSSWTTNHLSQSLTDPGHA
ncbi:hypothetical protein CGCF413_v000673 [Colletotrichum fructicola]|nr:hypothetical protein CGCF413_v000673 [Colletotrichum fructicola]